MGANMNSKRKGKVGELEASKEWGRVMKCEARRGQQFSGSQESPDVVHNIDGLHLEIKRTEKIQVYPAMEQSKQDAGDDLPIVLTRRNQKPWVFCCYLNDLPAIIDNVNDHRIRYGRTEL